MPPPIEVLGTFKSGRTGLKDAQHSVRPSTSLQGEEKLGPLLSPAKEKKNDVRYRLTTIGIGQVRLILYSMSISGSAKFAGRLCPNN